MENISEDVLPVKEETLPFDVPKMSLSNPTPKKINKTTLFINDNKNKQESDKGWAYYERNMKNFEKFMQSAKRKVYSCDTENCKEKNHIKNPMHMDQDFMRDLLCEVRRDFPNCIFAMDNKAAKKKTKKNKRKNSVNKKKEEKNDENEVKKIKKKLKEIKNDINNDKNDVKEDKKKELTSNAAPTQKVINKGESTDVVTVELTSYHPQNGKNCAFALEDLMFADIKIGNSGILRALLDTGATISMVDAKFMDDIDGDWKKSDIAIKGLGNSKGMEALCSLQRKVILEGVVMNPGTFHCMPNIELGFDAVLGRDFLQLNKVTIHPQQRKIIIGLPDSQGKNCIFSIIEVENKNKSDTNFENNLEMELPCYITEEVTLVKNEVTEIEITSYSSGMVQQHKLEQENLVFFLEVDGKLTGYYPNFGFIRNKLDKQKISIISGTDKVLQSGTKIGVIISSLGDELPKRIGRDWEPKDNIIYTILTDQQVAEAINTGPENQNTSRNPTAVLDDIPKFGALPMEDTPEEYSLGHHARIFPPRDMDLFNRQHEELLRNPQSDDIADEWTMEKIKKEFILPENILTDEQKERFYGIIYKYRVAFNRNSHDLFLATVGEVNLELSSNDYSKLSAKPTRWSPETNLIIREILDGYLKSGVIKHGSGPYSSRVFVVYRRTNPDEPKSKLRLVIDYRNINKSLVPCSKYLAGVDSLLMKVKNHKYYSKLDLKGAYHQVGLVEQAKDISSIVTMDSQFVFNVMLFGLSVAPGYFESFMEHCFKAVPDEELAHYLDDCIIPADVVDDMLVRIENFLYLIVKHRMKLSPDKSEFFKSRISFLGFILDESGVRKSPEYVQRIRDAPKPLTVHELMKFLGLVNFQRRFVPHCSEIIAPLVAAVEHKAKNIKKKEVKWTSKMEEAFEKIKEELEKDVALAFPQTGEDAKELKLFVDASNISIGSALMQEQQGELRPISYVSKLLSKTELRYSSYDKEILGS